eukprot:SAG31_NODE_7377_length_1704_cov_3.286604_2_plen_158_part_00
MNKSPRIVLGLDVFVILVQASAVEFVPLIEVIASRLSEPQNVPMAEQQADRVANGAFVVGAPVPFPAWKDIVFSQEQVMLEIDGEIVQDVNGANGAHQGDPFKHLMFLANSPRPAGDGLPVGTVVTTGSLKGMTSQLRPGLSRGIFGEFGTVEVEFV